MPSPFCRDINENDIHRDRNTWMGLAAVLLWSSTIALARRLSEQLGPLTAGAAVYLVAGLLLASWRFRKERSLRPLGLLPRRYVYGCGALFVIYTVVLFVALWLATDRIQTLEIGLLNYLWPAFTLLFSLFILGHRAGIGLLPGTLLALFGMVLVLTEGAAVTWRSAAANVLGNPAAYGLGFLAAIAWALYSNLSRRWGPRDGDGAVWLFMLAAGIAFGLLGLASPEAGSWSAGATVEVLFLALATALAYVFWDRAMRGGDMVRVVAFSYLTPFFSTIVSCLYLGVLPGPSLWLGCLFIVGGSFLSRRSLSPAVMR